MCPRGVLPQPVPQPADEVREAAAETALPPDGVIVGHRAAVLCAPRGQDPNRDPHQGHAPLGQHLPVADHCGGGCVGGGSHAELRGQRLPGHVTNAFQAFLWLAPSLASVSESPPLLYYAKKAWRLSEGLQHEPKARREEKMARTENSRGEDKYKVRIRDSIKGNDLK